MTAKNEMAPVAAGGMAVPDFMKGKDVGTTGVEDMSEEKTTPRIQLAQAMSPQVKKKDEQYIDGLEEGMFFNALTGEVLGETFEGYILKAYPSRALFDDDNSVDCYSGDNVHGSKHSEFCKDCPLGKWDNETSTPPACSSFDNYIVLAKGSDVPAVLGIKKTNKFASGEARNLNTHLALHAHLGAFAATYQFTGRSVQNARKQSFFVTSAKPVGYVEDEALYNRLAAMADQFAHINTMGGKHGDE